MALTRLTIFVACALALAGPTFAADDAAPTSGAANAPADTTAAAAPAASAEQIAKWVRELDADAASTRDAAEEKLTKAGKPAVGPVAEAVKGKSLEVTLRGVAVLKALSKSEDEPTRQAAQAALEKLAADQTHQAGQEARRVLNEGKPKRIPRNAADVAALGAFIVQMRAGAAGQAVKMSVRTVNGRKEVNVTEPQREIKITEDKDAVVVTVTDKAADNKKPKPKEYKAANAAELKKKHPEAYKLYEQYANQKNGNIVLNVGNVQLGQAAAAARIAAARQAALANRASRRDPRKAGKLIDEAQKDLKATVEKLKAGQKDGLDAKALADLLKQIEALEAKLTEARKSLP